MAETELPGLALAPGEDAVAAWARLPAGTRAAYVRFPRGDDLPLAALQRLARRGTVLADAGPRDAADAVDLAVAGATGVVAWLADGSDVAGIAEALGDGLLLGCTRLDLDEAARTARTLGVPLLVRGAEPPAGLHGYTLDTAPPVFALRRFGAWPDEAAA
ncbi:MAG TPA: hypothetical protein VHI93_05960, partial [Candidatus Thermoplasmatota archaeon]|nr:hypothetical protein [Candidatus Thermoplasmatota archaeon]